jgi:chromosome segregation ATPase
MFTSAQRQRILAEARANLAKREPVSSGQTEIIHKRRDDAAVSSAPASASSEASAGSELSWWQWVYARIAEALEAHGEMIGTAMGEYVACEIAPLKRENELLRREVTQLREQVGLERELRALRTDVEEARGQVPQLPAIVGQFKTEQARLQREIKTTQEKLKAVKIDQVLADRRLAQLAKATETRASAMEMKIETTVFEMREVHPDAQRALRDFAGATLKGRDEKVWIFEGPAAGTA